MLRPARSMGSIFCYKPFTATRTQSRSMCLYETTHVPFCSNTRSWIAPSPEHQIPGKTDPQKPRGFSWPSASSDLLSPGCLDLQREPDAIRGPARTPLTRGAASAAGLWERSLSVRQSGCLSVCLSEPADTAPLEPQGRGRLRTASIAHSPRWAGHWGTPRRYTAVPALTCGSARCRRGVCQPRPRRCPRHTEPSGDPSSSRHAAMPRARDPCPAAAARGGRGAVLYPRRARRYLPPVPGGARCRQDLASPLCPGCPESLDDRAEQISVHTPSLPGPAVLSFHRAKFFLTLRDRIAGTRTQHMLFDSGLPASQSSLLKPQSFYKGL